MSLRLRRALCFLLFSTSALCTTQITFYSDAECSVYVHDQIGPDDGCCQTITFAFKSFLVNGTKSSCPVTVYRDDIPFCSSNIQTVATIGHCYTNTTIGTYSIDCPSGFQASTCPYYPISSTGAPSLAKTTSTPTPSASSSLKVVSTTVETPATSASSSTPLPSTVKTSGESTLGTLATGSTTSSTRSTQTDVPTTSVLSTVSTSVSVPESNATGLPFGVKIGIGIAAGVAALIITIVSLICWRKRRTSIPTNDHIWQDGRSRVRNISGLYELDNTNGPFELHHIPDKQYQKPLTLYTPPVSISEMGGRYTSRDLGTPNSAATTRFSYETDHIGPFSSVSELHPEMFEPAHKYIMPFETKVLK